MSTTTMAADSDSDTGSATAGVADFKGDCGESRSGYYSAVCAGGMQVDQSATVNGSSPQNCVIANDGARVFVIELQRIAGIYDYQIRVNAQGPRGAGSGYMYLAYQDMTDDIYHLRIWSSTRQWHYVSFNSSSPAIKKIFWSNKAFGLEEGDPNRPKPDYQVISPAHPES